MTKKCTEQICFEEHCQHGVDILKDCDECLKLPFCKRIYDGDKNNCSYNKSFGYKGRCVYCGELPPITKLTDSEGKK